MTTSRSSRSEYQWDLVVMTYSWAPMNKPEFIRRIYDGLNAGGLVLVEDNEGYLRAQTTGNNFLLKWFENFRMLRYEMAKSGGEWGNPENAVYRLLAQKP
jgi:hypothetical protein